MHQPPYSTVPFATQLLDLLQCTPVFGNVNGNVFHCFVINVLVYFDLKRLKK